MKYITLFAALLASLCITDVSYATPSVSVEDLTMRAEVVLTAPPEVQTCNADNGEVLTVIHIQGVGPVVSTNQADLVGGSFYVDATMIHRPDGSGISFDNLKITNASGETVITGVARALDPVPVQNGVPVPLKAFVTGTAFDGGVLWAHSTVSLPPPQYLGDPNYPIVIEYGVASPGVQDLAVVTSGMQYCLRSLGYQFPAM